MSAVTEDDSKRWTALGKAELPRQRDSSRTISGITGAARTCRGCGLVAMIGTATQQ